jgi:amino acid adenylation domain-containing protein
MTQSLVSYFLESVEKYPERAALIVDNNIYTYSGLFKIASSYAATLNKFTLDDKPPLTAIFASRTLTAFAGLISTLLRGFGYVPLNPKHPPARSNNILKQTGCRSVVVDKQSYKVLDEVLKGVEHKVAILLPDIEDVSKLKKSFPNHTIIGANEIAQCSSDTPRIAQQKSIAYVMFTSGSTGAPKGVMVSHSNLIPLIDFFIDRYEICASDRISLTFALTFDPSVFNMFLAWGRGACLCCLSDNELLYSPGKFINEHRITIWNSVPSMVQYMKRLGMLKKCSYPNIRLSIFGAEPLPVDLVESWSCAAPQSEIENVYGPTELTINCTYYRWNAKKSPRECYKAIVPIGYPNPGMKVLVCDENLKEVPPGENGELLMSGPQVSLGYLNDREKTRNAFIVPPGMKELYYRTGDIVRRPVFDGPLLFIGRTDSQLKIQGHRIELGEIESVIRTETGINEVVAIGWPLTDSGAIGIEVFIQTQSLNLPKLKRTISAKLPKYMMPNGFHLIPRIPLNENGKYCTRSLHRILDSRR